MITPQIPASVVRFRRPRRFGFVLAALSLLVLPACRSTQTDPRYNRYCPNDGDPTLLDRGESCIDTAEEILNNVEERVEHRLF